MCRYSKYKHLASYKSACWPFYPSLVRIFKFRINSWFFVRDTRIRNCKFILCSFQSKYQAAFFNSVLSVSWLDYAQCALQYKFAFDLLLFNASILDNSLRLQIKVPVIVWMFWTVCTARSIFSFLETDRYGSNLSLLPLTFWLPLCQSIFITAPSCWHPTDFISLHSSEFFTVTGRCVPI